MKTRIISCLLLVSMLVATVVTSFAVSAEDVAADGQEAASVQIVSDVIDAYHSLDICGSGGSQAHGNNQCRLLYTDTGVYMSVPGRTPDGGSGSQSLMGTYKVNPDGTSELLFTSVIEGIAAGTTSQVMADAEGNIWTVTSWDLAAGLYYMCAWKYTPSTGTVEKFEQKGYAEKGGMWGKPIAIMDAKFNRIYMVCCGNSSKTGYLQWSHFDMTTNTWCKEMKVVKLERRCDYHYGYPDGKGGFYTVAENCPTNELSWTNIEGMSAAEAIKVYRSKKQDSGFIWMEPHMLYVPNPVDCTAKDCVAYDYPIERATFDVENGCYPNVYNCNGDLFLDEDTGYLYAIFHLSDNGQFGTRVMLFVFDTNQMNEDYSADGPFKRLVKKELTFAMGYSSTYTNKFYKDDAGNIYIVATPEDLGVVEIWKATDNTLAQDFKLVYATPFTGVLNIESGKGVYGTMINTTRNNSKMGDVAHMASWVDSAWYNYTVDFAALRSYLANK